MTQRRRRFIRLSVAGLLGIGSIVLARGPASGAEAPRISWRVDLARAADEARARQRPLWIQFTGPWCHFCHLMDRTTFTDPRIVGQARDRFVPVQLQSEGHEDLIARFEIDGLPATVIVAPTGEVLSKNEGYVDGPTFHAFLESARARFAPPPPLASAPMPARERAVAESRPATTDGVALAGFCPVSLVQEHRLVPGQDAVTLNHDGRTYRFANSRDRGTFQRQPEMFVPVNGGRCPVTQVDRGDRRVGDPRFGILYQGHLYLCADEASRARFLKQPERYCHVDQADRDLCPHCWGRRFVLAKAPALWFAPKPGERRVSSGFDQLEASRDPSVSTTRR